tara:strand:+ start:51 stop:548 length:498 start_codon:yes stop_codon:yes gene_type:complete
VAIVNNELEKLRVLNRAYSDNKDLILQIKELLENKELIQLIKTEGIVVPLSIFNEKNSSLEAITRYLKDILHLSYSEIAKETGRDERNIWHTYDRAVKKNPKKITPKISKYYLPISILKNKKLSVLETIIVYLKDNLKLSFSEISKVMKRNYRTIWTVYQRANKK